MFRKHYRQCQVESLDDGGWNGAGCPDAGR